MQEESFISLFLFLIAQTIAIWKKLEHLEAKIDNLARENAEQDREIQQIRKTVAMINRNTTKKVRG